MVAEQTGLLCPILFDQAAVFPVLSLSVLINASPQVFVYSIILPDTVHP